MKNRLIEVTLEHKANPDIRPSGYWTEPKDSGAERVVRVRSIKEAQQVCSRYIDDNALGGSNWTGGEVCVNGIAIGRVSYNGRYWPLET